MAQEGNTYRPLEDHVASLMNEKLSFNDSRKPPHFMTHVDGKQEGNLYQPCEDHITGIMDEAHNLSEPSKPPHFMKQIDGKQEGNLYQPFEDHVAGLMTEGVGAKNEPVHTMFRMNEKHSGNHSQIVFGDDISSVKPVNSVWQSSSNGGGTVQNRPSSRYVNVHSLSRREVYIISLILSINVLKVLLSI